MIVMPMRWVLLSLNNKCGLVSGLEMSGGELSINAFGGFNAKKQMFKLVWTFYVLNCLVLDNI